MGRQGLSQKEQERAQAGWTNADELAKKGQYRVDVIGALIAGSSFPSTDGMRSRSGDDRVRSRDRQGASGEVMRYGGQAED